MQIAIDGPASAGKSTIAKIVAKKLNYVYTDTGAMYRTVTLMAKRNKVDYGDESKILKLMNENSISFKVENGAQHVFLNNDDVSLEIRTPDITNNVSQVSALPKVRKFLVEKQREIANNSNVVMDGRDIGTTVLPNADVKIFMIASVQERAQRRYKENLTRNINTPLKKLEQEIEARDYKDSHRNVSPLKKATDAVELDTTGLTIDQVVEQVLGIIKSKK